MKTLLLDMDGPLADFDAACWHAIKRNRWEVDLVDLKDGRREYYITNNMPVVSEAKCLHQLIRTKGWFRNLPTTNGCTHERVLHLMEHFDVWVCTKPLDDVPHCLSEKQEWLNERFPMLSQRLITAPNKGLISGDILLDDAPRKSHALRADWQPVVMPDTFNQKPNTWWGDLPSWSWGDDIEKLAVQAI